MSHADRAWFTLSLILATVAIPANLWGLRLASQRIQAMRAFIAILAAVYVSGYVWVLQTGDVKEWSETFRPVAPWAFSSVWILAPVFATMERRKIVRKVAAHLVEITGEVPDVR